MVVLLAAGNTPNLTFNPVESIQAMTAFIATTATGDIATGSITYKTVFAVALLLFLMTLVMNVLIDPARSQVPGGLRVSDEFDPRTARAEIAIAGARGVTAAILSDQPRGDVVRNTIFASLLFLAIAIALAGLALLIGETSIKGWPRLNIDLLTQRHLVAARQRRPPVGDHRHALDHGLRDPLHRPDRGRSRDLPRGVREQGKPLALAPSR